MNESSSKISVLAIRVAVWFILLSSLPLLVLIFFVRQNTQTVFLNLENRHRHELAALLAEQSANVGSIESIRNLLLTLENDALHPFVLSSDGSYLAHPDASKINKMATGDFLPETIMAILAEHNGIYVEPSTSIQFAFAPIPGRDALVVISAKNTGVANVILQLERESILQLLVAVLIMVVGSVVVIWLLIGLPVRKLTHAAKQIGAGNLHVPVDSSDMIDDLAVLGVTFNTMTDRINELVENLERRVAARTEELSTFFDLTLLAGQATNLASIFQQAMPRILEVTHTQVIYLHLVDDTGTCLRLVAQQNLPATGQPLLQTVDLSADFLRWLQQPNDTLVTTSLPTFNLLPNAFRLKGYQTYLGAQVRTGDRIAGLLSCYRISEHGFGLDEISLVTALAEQLGMVLEIYHLRQTARDVAILEERQRLARDLHDSVTQSAYSLTLFAQSAVEAVEDKDTPRLTENLADIETSTRSILQELRLLLYELQPPLLEEEGLVQALDIRLNRVERRAGLQVDYHTNMAGIDLPKTVEIEFYWLAIEALNNIIKHANARHLSLDLRSINGAFKLTIIDDGCGFDPGQKLGGFGLTGMRERANRLGGTLTVDSSPGRGTQIVAEVGGANG